MPAAKRVGATNTFALAKGRQAFLSHHIGDLENLETLSSFKEGITHFERLFDVGVAGIHRLLAHRKTLADASVVIVVAGMEGALASVVSGLVASPLVAVPTSVGYGANFGGLAPLLSMLNSCAPGVAVVNIDNGFGAAAFAHLVLMRIGAGTDN